MNVIGGTFDYNSKCYKLKTPLPEIDLKNKQRKTAKK